MLDKLVAVTADLDVVLVEPAAPDQPKQLIDMVRGDDDVITDALAGPRPRNCRAVSCLFCQLLVEPIHPISCGSPSYRGNSYCENAGEHSAADHASHRRQP